MKRQLTLPLAAVVVGACAGTASAVFLKSLELATTARDLHPGLIWLLPVAGFAVGLLYHGYGRAVERGTDLILDAIHEPRAAVPFRLAPLVLIGTVVTHLCGGSAGREGTAVQMGGACAAWWARMFKLAPAGRRALLMAGISGGFGSVFGVPWAGAVFGLEVLGLRPRARGEALACVIASFVGHGVTTAWGIAHTVYPAPPLPAWSWATAGALVLAGGAFGLCAMTFVKFTHLLARGFKKGIAYPPLRPLVGGGLVATGFYLAGTTRYAGLGVPVIEEALTRSLGFHDFAYKLGFTALTLGAGFKGGEVTPLLFIGATLGSALSGVLATGALATNALAAVGLVAVFAGAAKTPVACTVMAMELFGPAIGAFALVACVISRLCAGGRGLYARAPGRRPSG